MIFERWIESKIRGQYVWACFFLTSEGGWISSKIDESMNLPQTHQQRKGGMIVT